MEVMNKKQWLQRMAIDFRIPLGEMFEMVKHLPFTDIGDRLSFVLRFAAYSDVIRDAGVTSGSTTKPARWNV